MKDESLKAVTEVVKPKSVTNSLAAQPIFQAADIDDYLEKITHYEQELLTPSIQYIDDSIALLEQVDAKADVNTSAPFTGQNTYTPVVFEPQLKMGQ
jgi:hypothetical protein